MRAAGINLKNESGLSDLSMQIHSFHTIVEHASSCPQGKPYYVLIPRLSTVLSVLH